MENGGNYHYTYEALQSKPQKRREKEGILEGLVSLRKKRMGTIKIQQRERERERERERALHSTSPICWSRSFKDTLVGRSADTPCNLIRPLPRASVCRPTVDKILHLSPFSKARLIARPFRPGQADRQTDTPLLLRMSATAKSPQK